MKTFLKIIGIIAVVGIIGAGIVGAVAFAQGPQSGSFGFRGQMGRMSFNNAHGPMGSGLMDENMEETMHAAIADALGITEQEFEDEMAAGKTMFQIADEHNVDINIVWSAMQSARADALQQAVNDGTITQDQADWMSQRGAGMMSGGMGGYGAHGSNGGQYNGDCPYNTAQ